MSCDIIFGSLFLFSFSFFYLKQESILIIKSEIWVQNLGSLAQSKKKKGKFLIKLGGIWHGVIVATLASAP
jgi:hypothetical protein